MSLEQFQESSQIGVFYSHHHYYDPGSTLIHPLPPRQCRLESSVANIDTYFACLMSVQRSQFSLGEGWGNWN